MSEGCTCARLRDEIARLQLLYLRTRPAPVGYAIAEREGRRRRARRDAAIAAMTKR